MARPRTGFIVASLAASLPWVACSSGPSATARDGARDRAELDASGGDGADGATDGGAEAGPSGPFDPNGPYAACNDPLTQTSTLRGVGFDAWEGFALQGCFNPSQPDVDNTKCDDGTVTGGAFTIELSVCTGDNWDFHVFDAVRGLDCNTTRPAIDKVFTLTPADCTCGSPGRVPATGCDEMEGGTTNDAGPDAIDDAPRDANDGGAG